MHGDGVQMLTRRELVADDLVGRRGPSIFFDLPCRRKGFQLRVNGDMDDLRSRTAAGCATGTFAATRASGTTGRRIYYMDPHPGRLLVAIIGLTWAHLYRLARCRGGALRYPRRLIGAARPARVLGRGGGVWVAYLRPARRCATRNGGRRRPGRRATGECPTALIPYDSIIWCQNATRRRGIWSSLRTRGPFARLPPQQQQSGSLDAAAGSVSRHGRSSHGGGDAAHGRQHH